MINLILILLLLLFSTKYTGNLYCGIVAFSGKNNYNIDKIKLLLVWNSFLRGKDATGFYTPKNGIVKKPTAATDFLVTDLISPDNLFVGHVRAQTVGSNTLNNTHPFHYGQTIGVHNGTLSNHWELLRENNWEYSKFDVDSQVLINLIETLGPITAFESILGAAAVVYTKENTNELLVYRNADRPLFRGKNSEGMYISSEPKALLALGCGGVKEFKENQLYSIKDGCITHYTKIKRKEEPKKENTNYDNSNKNWKHDASNFNNKYVGKWLQCDRLVAKYYYSEEEDECVVKGNFYYIKSVDSLNNSKVNVLCPETGKTLGAWISDFNLNYETLSDCGFAEAMYDISHSLASQGLFCKKGTILYIQYLDEQSGEAYVSTLDGAEATLGVDLIRPLSREEEILKNSSLENTEEDRETKNSLLPAPYLENLDPRNFTD